MNTYSFYDTASPFFFQKNSPFPKFESRLRPIIEVSLIPQPQLKQLFQLLTAKGDGCTYDLWGTEQEIQPIIDLAPPTGSNITITNCSDMHDSSLFQQICEKFSHVQIIPMTTAIGETWLDQLKLDILIPPTNSRLTLLDVNYRPRMNITLTYTTNSHSLLNSQYWAILELTEEAKMNGYCDHNLIPKARYFLWYDPIVQLDTSESFGDDSYQEKVPFCIHISSQYPYAIISIAVPMTNVELNQLIPETCSRFDLERRLLALPSETELHKTAEFLGIELQDSPLENN